MTRTYRLNGKTYAVPLEVAATFDVWLKEVWWPNIPTQWPPEANYRHVPASFRSHCFSRMLAEHATEKWAEYIVE